MLRSDHKEMRNKLSKVSLLDGGWVGGLEGKHQVEYEVTTLSAEQVSQSID